MTKSILLQKKLLKWFDEDGRKDLPWQQDKSPYRVWVSEVMLQQTQVKTVIAFFQRFMAKFPTIEELANGDEEEVLHLWTGLGYYQRARNLHKTAKIIVHEYAGVFPQEVNLLEKLPGIGRSTAGAIVAIAFAKKATILDGNVKRVLTRLHSIKAWPGEKQVTDKLWSLAEHYTPKRRVDAYTQAIMDLGATICVRGKPDCQRCPWQQECIAFQQGEQSDLPVSAPRKVLPVRLAVLLVLQHQETVLLEKRPAVGVWSSLWSLPQIPGRPTMAEVTVFCREKFALSITHLTIGQEFRHTFTHFHLDILPIFIKTRPALPKAMEEGCHIWYNLCCPQKIGLPAPVKSLLASLPLSH